MKSEREGSNSASRGVRERILDINRRETNAGSTRSTRTLSVVVALYFTNERFHYEAFDQDER